MINVGKLNNRPIIWITDYQPDGHDYQTYMIMWMNLVDNPRNWSFNPWFIIYSLVIYRFAIENGHKIVDVPIENCDFL